MLLCLPHIERRDPTRAVTPQRTKPLGVHAVHDALPGAAHEYSSHATHEVPEARCPAPHDAGTGEVEGVTLLVRLGVPLPVRLPVGVADTVDDDDADAPRLGVAVGVDALDGVMLLVGWAAIVVAAFAVRP